MCQVRTGVRTKRGVMKPRCWSAFQEVDVGLITRRSQVQILPPLPMQTPKTQIRPCVLGVDLFRGRPQISIFVL